MRQLLLLSLVIVILIMFSCHRNKAEADFERFLEKKDTATMEFITPKEDPVKLEDDINQNDNVLGGDDDGLMVIPDIPKEHKVNMHSNTYELEKMMQGRQ